MNMIRLGYYGYLKNLGVGLLLSFQLAIGLLLISIGVSGVYQAKAQTRIFEALATEDSYYVMRSAREGAETEAFYRDSADKVGSIHIAFPSYDAVVPRLKIPGKEYPWSKRARVMAYSDGILSRLDIPLKKGAWLKPTANNAGEPVPIVVGRENKDFRLGQTVTLQAETYAEEGMPQRAAIVCKVVGVLANSRHHLHFQVSGTGVDCTDLISRYDFQANEEFLILCRWEDVREALGQSAFSGGNTLLFLEGLDAAERDALLHFAQEKGVVESTQSLLEKGRAKEKLEFYKVLPLLFSALAISFVGILSSGILSALRNKRSFGVFYLCGGRWRHCLFYTMGYICCIIAVALLLVLLLYVFAILLDFFGETGYYFTWRNVLAMGAFLLLLIFGTALPTYLSLKNTAPVVIVKNNE